MRSSPRFGPFSRRQRAARLRLEPLEARLARAGLAAPAADAPGFLAAPEPNDTVDVGQDLGSLDPLAGARFAGTIGDGPAGAADVDWYGFTLDRPARVVLEADPAPGAAAFRAVLGLYSNDATWQDPTNPTGHRLMAQQPGAGSSGVARVERLLAPGRYDVAVSGAGNLDFSPLMPGSGLPGATGPYRLTIDATPLATAPGDGPIVVATEPAAGAALDAAPAAIRLAMSAPLDPGTVAPGANVRLLAADGTSLDIAWASFSPVSNELQVLPAAPLAPGAYRVELTGQAGGDAPNLAGPDGTPLGATADAPLGRDFAFTFQVAAAEGGLAPGAADDTPATARDLGDLSAGGLVRVAGTIGDDPYFDPSRLDDNGNPLNPGNDVDMYRFSVRGPGRFALVAEGLAGRIGSTLDAGLSLYRLDPATGAAVFVAGNNNSQNYAPGTDGTPWLFTDPVLFAGLEAGDYVLAVSSGCNTPSPLEDQAPGSDGLFDPMQSHSGLYGWSTGPYVLQLAVHPTAQPPRVAATSPSEMEQVDHALTQFTVRFDQPMNLDQLAQQAYHETSQATVAAVYVAGADGTRYVPRLQSFDPATNTATFLMLDALRDGFYALHLSGAAGLTSLSGLPLAGDDASGDKVVHFFLVGADHSVRDDASGAHVINATPTADGPADLGILFPHELQDGVTLLHAAQDGGGSGDDEYRFVVLQDQDYHVTLSGDDLPNGLHVALLDEQGNPIDLPVDPTGRDLTGHLQAGVYRLRVEGGDGGAAGVTYRVLLGLLGLGDNAPPLLSGPAPAVSIRFAADPVASPTPGGTNDGPAGGGSVSVSIPGEQTSGGSGAGSSSGGGVVVSATGVPAGPVAYRGGSTEGPVGGTSSGSGSGSSSAPEAAHGASGPAGGLGPGVSVALAQAPVGGAAGAAHAPLALASVQIDLDGAAPRAQNTLLAGLTSLLSTGTILPPAPEVPKADAEASLGTEDGPEADAPPAEAVATESDEGPAIAEEPAQAATPPASGAGPVAVASVALGAPATGTVAAAGVDLAGESAGTESAAYASSCMAAGVRLLAPFGAALVLWWKFRPERAAGRWASRRRWSAPAGGPRVPEPHRRGRAPLAGRT